MHAFAGAVLEVASAVMLGSVANGFISNAPGRYESTAAGAPIRS